MGNSSGYQCKVKMSGTEKKVNENTYDIFSKKRVTIKTFLEVSHGSRVRQRQRNMQKKCAALGRVVQSWVNITQSFEFARFEFRFESLKSISVLILFVYNLMIGSSKNNRESYPTKCF